MSRLVKIVLLIVAAVIGLYFVASFAVSSLTGSRIQGNEASAKASVRMVQSAQMVFAAVECSGLYAPRLTALATNGYLASDLAAADVVEKSGYRITLQVPGAAPDQPDLPPTCAGAVPSFVVTAEPVEPGRSGAHYFRATEEGELVEATRADFSDATPAS